MQQTVSERVMAQVAKTLETTALEHKRQAAFHRRRMREVFKDLSKLKILADALGFDLVYQRKGEGKKSHGRNQ